MKTLALRIAQSYTLLPLGSAINRVPRKCFHKRVVVRALRGFPQQDVSLRGTKVPPDAPSFTKGGQGNLWFPGTRR